MSVVGNAPNKRMQSDPHKATSFVSRWDEALGFSGN